MQVTGLDIVPGSDPSLPILPLGCSFNGVCNASIILYTILFLYSLLAGICGQNFFDIVLHLKRHVPEIVFVLISSYQ
jgi:hypothetical protein